MEASALGELGELSQPRLSPSGGHVWELTALSSQAADGSAGMARPDSKKDSEAEWLHPGGAAGRQHNTPGLQAAPQGLEGPPPGAEPWWAPWTPDLPVQFWRLDGEGGSSCICSFIELRGTSSLLYAVEGKAAQGWTVKDVHQEPDGTTQRPARLCTVGAISCGQGARRVDTGWPLGMLPALPGQLREAPSSPGKKASVLSCFGAEMSPAGLELLSIFSAEGWGSSAAPHTVGPWRHRLPQGVAPDRHCPSWTGPSRCSQGLPRRPTRSGWGRCPGGGHGNPL